MLDKFDAVNAVDADGSMTGTELWRIEKEYRAALGAAWAAFEPVADAYHEAENVYVLACRKAAQTRLEQTGHPSRELPPAPSRRCVPDVRRGGRA